MQSLHWLWSRRKQILRAFVLAVIGVVAVSKAVPRYASVGISSSHYTGLAAMEDREGGGFSTGSASDAEMSLADSPTEIEVSRKVASTSNLDLVVDKPAQAAEKIRALTERLGGYVVSSQIGEAGNNYASISIRIPVTHVDEAKDEIRKLAIHIESERTQAEDVTKQWVDTDAHLRNLRATEQQYLQILKRATTVKDTVEVTEKLGEVRGTIEQTQADFAALAKRVETVAISIDLRPDFDVQVLGLRWRPLYRAKLALRNAVDALGDYAASMLEVIFHIPVIALWLVTLVAFAAVGWKLLRWAARIFLGWKAVPKT